MSTLTYGSTPLTIPSDLLWADEFAWQQVEQRTEYSITGALIVESAAKLSGRPITLVGDEAGAWVLRSVVQTLRTWAALPAQSFTLAHNGSTYTVAFDHAKGAIDARPLVGYSDPIADDYYVVTFRFIEV